MFTFVHSFHAFKKEKNLHWLPLKDAKEPPHIFENQSIQGKDKHCPTFLMQCVPRDEQSGQRGFSLTEVFQ
jgi:hypothetical protein